MKRLLLVLPLLAALLVGGLVGAQDDDLSPELTEQIRELERVTMEIRELDGESVARDFPTRAEVIDYLGGLLDEELPPEEAERALDFYLALNLIDAPFDVRGVYMDLLGSQVAGFYDTETGVMNVIPLGGGELEDELSLTEQIIYVHEFTHALQDQFFDLDALVYDEAILDDPDRYLARLALVEGDATAVMNVYTEAIISENPMQAFALLGEGLAAGSFNIPEGVPPVLTRELLFPYEGGLIFVMALVSDGGWDAVDAAFANPPQSTEQILHPEKYLAGEAPLPVDLLGGEAVLGDDWERTWDGTLGEWYLRQHLDVQLARGDSNAAAAGWGGDRFHIYADDATGERALLLGIVWDDLAEADEFVTAYTEYSDTRFETTASDGCWSNDGGALCLLAVEDFTLVAAAPTVELAQDLIAAQG